MRGHCSEEAGAFLTEKRSGGRMVPLSAWHVRCKESASADAVVRAYGGVRLGSDASGWIECRLEAQAVGVLFSSSEQISALLVAKEGMRRTHVCDGAVFQAPPSEVGAPCGCAADPFERRKAARAGTGPQPDIRLRFHLVDLPQMGMFTLQSASWSLFDSLRGVLVGEAQSADGLELDLLLAQRTVVTRSGLVVGLVMPEARSRRRGARQSDGPRPKRRTALWEGGLPGGCEIPARRSSVIHVQAGLGYGTGRQNQGRGPRLPWRHSRR